MNEKNNKPNLLDRSLDQHDDTNLAEARIKPKLPPLYKVLLLNDDYTPMEFVILLLMKLFKMDEDNATQVMLHVHQRGKGVCGSFPREIAETKVQQIFDYAKKNQHPLKGSMEKE